MAVESEEMSLAVCNLLQGIIDALSGEDKQEHRGKEEALVLGRRRFSASVQGGWRQGSASYYLRLSIHVRGSGPVIFFHLFFDYKSNRGTVTFTRAKTWKQLKCPSMDEWTNKRWCLSLQWNIVQP